VTPQKKPYVETEAETFFFLCGTSGVRAKEGLCPEHKIAACLTKYSLDTGFHAELVPAGYSAHPKNETCEGLVRCTGTRDRDKCQCGLDFDETTATILYELTERNP
jgi:hypothetical protein